MLLNSFQLSHQSSHGQPWTGVRYVPLTEAFCVRFQLSRFPFICHYLYYTYFICFLLAPTTFFTMQLEFPNIMFYFLKIRVFNIKKLVMYYLLVTKKLADFLGAMNTNPDYTFCFSVGFFGLLGWIIFHFKTIHLCSFLRPDDFLLFRFL